VVPAVFSIGYGGGLLAHNRNLAEGLPVTGFPDIGYRGEFWIRKLVIFFDLV
jgi:hypothetical protein